MWMNSITAFFTALAGFFKLKETKIEKKTETDSTKAMNYAENIIELVELHGYFDTVANQDRFNRWKKHFRNLK